MKKRILFVILVLCFVFSLVGCDETSRFPEFVETKVKKLESGIVSENDKFELSWDQTKKRVILTDKESGVRWSSTPEEELDNNPIESGVKTHPQVDSPIYVSYYDNTNFVEKIAYGQTSAIKNGEVSAEKQGDMLSVNYIFEDEGFSVTVDYTLREDNLLVSVDTSKITENENNIVTEVALAPFFCSVQNNEPDSYLFVPSGSGALIYSDMKLTQFNKTSDGVFGYDYTIDAEEEFVKYETVKMPVYGAVNGDSGVCAIIEEGAEGASICTVTNHEKLGYASVYANFLTRGYDLISTPNGFYSAALKNKLYSEPIMNQTYSVAFYPFCGEDVSYVDMANIYREYLEETYHLSEYSSAVKENAINLNIIGGAECNNFFLGIPYDDFFATTTLEEAKSIIDQIRSIAGDVNVSLEGFGASGMDIGKPAGGIKINSKLGSYKDLSAMYDAFEGTGTSLFLNYDVVRFNSQGAGVSPIFDAAVTTNGKQTSLTLKSQETRLEDGEYAPYKLVSRNSLGSLSTKILEYASKSSIKGVGFSTLSNMAYSDYANEDYFAKLGMSEQVSQLLQEYREQNVLVMGNSANVYAAVNCDYISEVPTTSSNYDSFDVDVPFYQIVFKGYVPMSVSSVNLATNENTTLLKALESGVGLNYTLINRYDEELINSFERDFYGMNKDNVIEEIKTVVNDGVCETLNELAGATIEEHIVVNEFVRKTVFSNGIEVWVNYGDAVYSEGNVTVDANHYYVER